MGQPLSINQLSALTGKDRRTIDARLAGLACTPGPKNAKLYDSAIALQRIFVADSQGTTYDEARTALALSQKRTSDLRGDEVERTRIPLPIVSGIWDAHLQSAAAIIKAAKGVPVAKRNEILAALRAAVMPATW